MTNPDNVGGLLPCPFCGAEPKLVKCVGYDQGQSSISCANCDVYMMDIHSHVIETWNRRELCRAAPAGGDVKPSEPQLPPGHRWLDPEIDMLTEEEARRLRREP